MCTVATAVKRWVTLRESNGRSFTAAATTAHCFASHRVFAFAKLLRKQALPMKRNSLFAILLALSTLVAFSAPKEIAAKKRMVVVISLDGFPGFALEDAKTPV